MYSDKLDYKLYYQRKLPHYQPENGVFFITFRQAFTLPVETQNDYTSYRRNLINAQHQKTNAKQSEIDRTIAKKLFSYYDSLLTTHNSDNQLTSNSQTAQIIMNVLLELRDQLYILYCFTIMPNHIHLLLKPMTIEGKYVSLGKIVKDIKGISARYINNMFDRVGSVWAREYFDYWVRNETEFNNIVNYIRQNPVQAKLVNDPNDWQWTWINSDLLDSDCYDVVKPFKNGEPAI